ncbi:MAG: addiction module antidote protein [Bryobacteraceae bacterium]
MWRIETHPDSGRRHGQTVLEGAARGMGKPKKIGALVRNVPFETIVEENIRRKRDAIHYLNAALEEEDPRVFLVALQRVAKVHGGMERLAGDANLNRVSLYRMLSKRGNPSLTSLNSILRAIGLRISIEAA